MRRNKKTVSLDGIFKQNIVLMSGLVTAPIIVAATSAERALVLVMSFFLISYTSILICRAIPRKLAYSIRIFLYATVAGVMYIPTRLLLGWLFPATTDSVQLYIGLLVVNSLLLAKTEMRFYLKPFGEMAVDSLMYIAGYAMVAFVVGFLREVLAYGTLFGYHLVNPIVPAAKSPFFGFILVGILAAICRAIVNLHRARNSALSDERLADEVTTKRVSR